jgi:rhodanese-related sulfurtransferase
MGSDLTPEEKPMAKTFMQMVQEAKAEVPGVSPVEAQRRFLEDPDALLLEVRDAGNIPVDEKAPNAVNVSLGTLPIRADLEVPEERRDLRLQDRSRQVVTTCGLGNLAALGARLLKEMGFTNVAYMEGGMQAWKDAGLPTD